MADTTFTGNPYIDGILWGGNQFDSNTITYSFWSNASLDDPYYDLDLINTEWLDPEIQAMELALETWSNVANIDFVQAPDNTASADLNFILVGNAEFDSLGLFSPPGTFGEGIGYFNQEGLGWTESGIEQGGFGFITLIHELGHGLGLAHPHDNGGGSSVYPGVSAPFGDTGDFGLNQGVWTTMSYNDGLVSNDYSGIFDYGYQGTPMAFDIAAIQHLYGANMSHNTGDEVYTLPTENGIGTFYSSIWDAGGYDTISAASASVDTTIHLGDAPLTGPNAGGYLSMVDGVYGGFTIANGVTIEAAIGGSGNDTIVGNEASNVLTGGLGNDKIYGASGSDTVEGYGGANGEYDLLTGDFIGTSPLQQDAGDGADLFVLGNDAGAYYLGLGHAIITDFYWLEEDQFQVHGNLADYSLSFQNVLGASTQDTVIQYQNDVVGVVRDTTDIDLARDFVFV